MSYGVRTPVSNYIAFCDSSLVEKGKTKNTTVFDLLTAEEFVLK
jgi:hypothetical protein